MVLKTLMMIKTHFQSEIGSNLFAIRFFSCCPREKYEKTVLSQMRKKDV